jgi:hypothetical protein
MTMLLTSGGSVCLGVGEQPEKTLAVTANQKMVPAGVRHTPRERERRNKGNHLVW